MICCSLTTYITVMPLYTLRGGEKWVHLKDVREK